MILYVKGKLECPHCQKEILVRTVHLDYLPKARHGKNVLTEEEYQELRKIGVIKIIETYRDKTKELGAELTG